MSKLGLIIEHLFRLHRYDFFGLFCVGFGLGVQLSKRFTIDCLHTKQPRKEQCQIRPESNDQRRRPEHKKDEKPKYEFDKLITTSGVL